MYHSDARCVNCAAVEVFNHANTINNFGHNILQQFRGQQGVSFCAACIMIKKLSES